MMATSNGSTCLGFLGAMGQNNLPMPVQDKPSHAKGVGLTPMHGFVSNMLQEAQRAHASGHALVQAEKPHKPSMPGQHAKQYMPGHAWASFLACAGCKQASCMYVTFMQKKGLTETWHTRHPRQAWPMRVLHPDFRFLCIWPYVNM